MSDVSMPQEDSRGIIVVVMHLKTRWGLMRVSACYNHTLYVSTAGAVFAVKRQIEENEQSNNPFLSLSLSLSLFLS